MILPLVFVSLLKRLLMLVVHRHNECFQNFLCIPLLLGRAVLQHHGGQGAILLTGAKQNIIRGHFQDGGDVSKKEKALP